MEMKFSYHLGLPSAHLHRRSTAHQLVDTHPVALCRTCGLPPTLMRCHVTDIVAYHVTRTAPSVAIRHFILPSSHPTHIKPSFCSHTVTLTPSLPRLAARHPPRPTTSHPTTASFSHSYTPPHPLTTSSDLTCW